MLHQVLSFFAYAQTNRWNRNSKKSRKLSAKVTKVGKSQCMFFLLENHQEIAWITLKSTRLTVSTVFYYFNKGVIVHRVWLLAQDKISYADLIDAIYFCSPLAASHFLWILVLQLITMFLQLARVFCNGSCYLVTTIMHISKRAISLFNNRLLYHSKQCLEAWSSETSFILIDTIRF